MKIQQLLQKDRQKSRLILYFGIIFIVALIVRLIFIQLFGRLPWADLRWNDVVGWNLAQGYGFTASQGEPRIPGLFRTPGYPAFLAVVYFFFGHSYFAVFVAQAALDSLSAVLIGLIALHYTSVEIAAITSALYALYPYSAMFCGWLHQDILVTFFVVVMLFVLVKASRREGGRWHWLLLGVVTGFGILVKPTILIYALMPVLTILFATPPVRRKMPALLMLGIGVVAIISPWLVRNYMLFNRFPLFAAGGMGGGMLFVVKEVEYGKEATFLNQDQVIDFELPWASEDKREIVRDGAKLLDREEEAGKKAREQLVNIWPKYLLWMLKTPHELWVTSYNHNSSGLTLVAARVISWFVLILGLMGMFILRRRWRSLLPLYLTIVLFTLMHLPLHREARYTLPARPVLILFVAATIANFNFTKRRWENESSHT